MHVRYASEGAAESSGGVTFWAVEGRGIIIAGNV